jgi:ribosomal protein S18 acetylase RimI-like enzyme
MRAIENRKMFVREACVEDIEPLAFVHSTSWKETYAGLLEDRVINTFNFKNRKKMWTNFFAESLCNQKAYVALYNDKVVGLASWRQHEGAMELTTLYVLSCAQKKGFGRILLEKVMQDSFTRNKDLFLWVLDGTPSCTFYEKMGLVTTRKEKKDLAGTLVTECFYSTENFKRGS